MNLWDRICIHACYRLWNPVGFILNDQWVEEVFVQYGPTYPGWKELR